MNEKVVLEDEESPWKTISSKKIYENKWMGLKEDKVIMPNGKEGIYAYISSKNGAAAVILNEKNEIYLVGQYRYAVDEYSWEIISGAVEKGEDYLTTVKREIEEEAGVTAKKFDLLHGDLQLSNSYTSDRGAIFLARDIEQNESHPESTEKLQIKKVPLDEAIRLICEGKIKDDYTITGIFLAKEFLEKEGNNH